MNILDINEIELPSRKNGYKRRRRKNYGGWIFLIGLLAFLGALVYFHYGVIVPYLNAIIPEAHACTSLEECCKEAGEFVNGNEVCN